MNNDLRKNGSGYYDPTAYKAIKNVDKDEDERFHTLLETLFYIIDLAGFEVEGRIILRNKKSRKVWR